VTADQQDPEPDPQRRSQPPEAEEGSGKATPNEGKKEISCDLCGSLMLERHCRLLCPRCGYQRDCSDP